MKKDNLTDVRLSRFLECVVVMKLIVLEGVCNEDDSRCVMKMIFSLLILNINTFTTLLFYPPL